MTDQLLDDEARAHSLDQCVETPGLARHEQVLRAAGVCRRLQTQPPRRVTAQYVALQHAVRDDIAIVCRHAFSIVRPARHGFFKVRPFLDLHEIREDLLAGGIEQERCAPILRTARDSADRVTDEAAGELGNEQHWCACRRDLACTQAGNRAPGRCFADGFTVFEITGIARGTVIVIALHLVALGREHDAADAVAGLRVAADKAMRIAVRARAAIAGHRGAFRIIDAWIETQCRRLAIDGHRDRIACLDGPGVIEVQVPDLHAHQRRIGEPRILVFSRAGGKCAGFLDGFANGFRAHVGSACVPLA